MHPVEKKAKKRQKAGGRGQPTEEAANNLSNISYSSFYGDEELVDCEPESPARYLGDEGDILPDYDYWPAHGDGPDTIIQSMSNLPVIFDGRLQRAWPEALAILFREGVVRGASEIDVPELCLPVGGEKILPLLYSSNNDAIEMPAPGVQALVLATLSRGLKRPAPGRATVARRQGRKDPNPPHCYSIPLV
jgi:hypothetical protein